MADPPLRVGVFGIGEAGRELAAGLIAAGAVVSAYDPAPVPTPEGVRRCTHPADAVAEVSLVLAVTAASDAETALTQALDELTPGTIYADLATASARLEQHLAAVAAERGLGFVDVALMSTVPGRGLAVPALASGPAAAAFVATLGALGMPVTDVGPEAGAAATRKLVRSVAVKGLAGVVIEAMRAARAAGTTDETWQNLVHQLTDIDEAFLRRLVEGTGTHAVRRLAEMEAGVDVLIDLGVEPVMTRATVEHLRRIPADGLPDLPPPR